MNKQIAISILRSMQSQIVHGSNIFVEIADFIDELVPKEEVEKPICDCNGHQTCEICEPTNNHPTPITDEAFTKMFRFSCPTKEAHAVANFARNLEWNLKADIENWKAACDCEHKEKVEMLERLCEAKKILYNLYNVTVGRIVIEDEKTQAAFNEAEKVLETSAPNAEVADRSERFGSATG